MLKQKLDLHHKHDMTSKVIGHKSRMLKNSQIEQAKRVGLAFALDEAKEFGIVSEIRDRIIRFATLESGGAEIQTAVDHLERDLVERHSEGVCDIVSQIDQDGIH